jgi:tRNA A-37 threonylcarbamoyl transferase component Bud32
MGTIYIAHHEALDKTVVVKVLPPNLASDPEYQKRFLREARAAAKLEHPNIVQIYDAASEGDMPYIVMQFIEGQDLQVLLDKKGKAPIGDALSITKKVAQALAFAHKQGIVHRDIKPSNIMISKQGKVMVTDFGLARQISGTMSATVTQGGVVLGTPDYISPEQAMGERTDGRTDIYSLGCTLYRMIAGRPPYEDPNPVTVMMKHVRDTDQPEAIRKLAPEASEAVEKLVDRMLKKNPSERFQTMEEVIAAIDACKGKGAGAGSRVETSPVAHANPPTAAIAQVAPKRTILIVALSAIGTLFFLVLLGFILRPSAATRDLNSAKDLERRAEQSDSFLPAALEAYRGIIKTHAGTKEAAEAQQRLDALEHRRVEKERSKIQSDYKDGKATFAASAFAIKVLRASTTAADEQKKCDDLWMDLAKAEVLARASRLAKALAEFEKGATPAERQKPLEELEALVNPDDVMKVGKVKVRERFVGLLFAARVGRITVQSIEVKPDSVQIAADRSRATLTLIVAFKSHQGEDKTNESPSEWINADGVWYVDVKEK